MNQFAPLEDVVASLGVLFEKREKHASLPDVPVETLSADALITEGEHYARLRDDALGTLNHTFAEARELSKKVPDVSLDELAPHIAQTRDTILAFQEADHARNQYQSESVRFEQEMLERMHNLDREENRLSTHFEGLGSLLHYRRLRRIAEERKKLSAAYRRTQQTSAAPGIDLLYHGNLKDALAVSLSHRIKNEYAEQWRAAAPKIELSEEVLDELYTAYSTSLLFEGIKRVQNHWAMSTSDLPLLNSDELRVKAHQIIKSKLRHPQQKIDDEAVRKLPAIFDQVISYARGPEHRYHGQTDHFTDLVNTINQSPTQTQERRALSESHDRIIETLSGFTGRADPYTYSSNPASDGWRSFEYTVEHLDLQAWNVLKEHPAMRQQHGDTLNAFHQLCSATAWNTLLRTSSPNEHQELRKAARVFSTTNNIPYLVYDFWKSVLIHGSALQESPEHQFVAALGDEQMHELEGMNIPGLMDVIRVMRTATDDYRTETIPNNPRLRNPRNAAIKRGLVDMTVHYLTHGTKDEAQFALSYAPFLQTPRKGGFNEPLFGALANRFGLDDVVVQAFKREPDAFNQRLIHSIGKSPRRYDPDPTADIKDDFAALARYRTGVDEILATALHPKAVWNEHQTVYSYLVQSSETPSHEVDRALAHLKLVDQDFIHDKLHGSFGECYNRALNKYRTLFAYQPLTDAFARLESFINKTTEIVEAVKDKPALHAFLKTEQRSLVSAASYSVLEDYFLRDVKAGCDYLTILQDEKIADLVKTQATNACHRIAVCLHAIPSEIAVPYIRNLVSRDGDASTLADTARGVAEMLSFWTLSRNQEPLEKNVLHEYLHDPAHLGVLDLLCELNHTCGPYRTPAVSANESFFDHLEANLSLLKQAGFQPTYFLVKELHTAEDKQQKITAWKSAMESFGEGTFDPANELHRNLEYSRFRKIVDHEKVKRHVKNHFTFDEYIQIFDRKPVDEQFSERDQFEIGCVAYEATLLADFIGRVNEQARAQHRPVWVVPNLSYGYLPVAPLVEECAAQGIESIIGVKVGSTESHSTPTVLNSRLFKGYRQRMMDEQPIIIVTDGTQHLVSRDDEHKSARYPDAHQGYLNQVIALNDAAGFTDIDYSTVGKTNDDVARLRNTEEFKRLVTVYRGVASDHPRRPYSFNLWNTAGLELAVRGNREETAIVPTTDPATIDGPAVIFCNIGVLDEQIPEDIARPSETKHTPAYFDDSGKIINFDFSYDRFGVRYLNRLETAVREAYAQRKNQPPSVSVPTESIPALIRFLERPRTAVEEVNR
ncbi:MAG: hypothetical protein Q7R76_05830 [Candidatus Woesearchaeota archaeon]|nr:hypothetical protein [Candidatus Woesearchaeota archaeon]